MSELSNNRISPIQSLPYDNSMEGILYPFHCPHCGNDAAYAVPVEPLYFVSDVYKLIPFSTLDAAKKYLWRHKVQYPPRFVRLDKPYGTGGARYKRVLSASDIRKLREARLYRPRLKNRSIKRRENYDG